MVEIDYNENKIVGVKLLDCDYVAEEDISTVKETLIVPDEEGNFTGINTRVIRTTTIRLKPVMDAKVDEDNVISIKMPQKEIKKERKVNKDLIPRLKKEQKNA